MSLRRTLNTSLARAIGNAVRATRHFEYERYASYDRRHPENLATQPQAVGIGSSENLRAIDTRLRACLPGYAGLRRIGSTALGTSLPGRSDVDVVAEFVAPPPTLREVESVLGVLGRCQVSLDECVSVAFGSGEVVDVVVASAAGTKQPVIHRSDGGQITIDALVRDWEFRRRADGARVDVRTASRLVKSWSRRNGNLMVSAEVDRLVRYQASNAGAFSKNDLCAAQRATFQFLTTYGGNQAAVLMTGWEPSRWDPDAIGDGRFARIRLAAEEALVDLDEAVTAATAGDLESADTSWRRIFGDAEPPWRS